MRILLSVAGLIAATIASPAVAHAAPDPGGDALLTCMVAKTSGRDRVTLVRWFVAGMASGQAAAGVATVDNDAKDAVDRDMADLFYHLLTVDCGDVVRTVIKKGGDSDMGVVFNSLARIAVKDMMSDPEANAAMSAFTQYIDPEKLKKIGH